MMGSICLPSRAAWAAFVVSLNTEMRDVGLPVGSSCDIGIK